MPLSAEDLATEIIEHVTQNGTVTGITVDPNTGAQVNTGSIG